MMFPSDVILNEVLPCVILAVPATSSVLAGLLVPMPMLLDIYILQNRNPYIVITTFKYLW